MKLFKTLECSSQNLSTFFCQFWNDNSIPLKILHPSSVSWKIVQAIYTLLKRNPLKWKFLRLSSALVKIRQIPHVNFEMTSQFIFKFCVFFIVMIDNSSVDFKLMLFQVWMNPNLGELFRGSFWGCGKGVKLPSLSKTC